MYFYTFINEYSIFYTFIHDFYAYSYFIFMLFEIIPKAFLLFPFVLNPWFKNDIIYPVIMGGFSC